MPEPQVTDLVTLSEAAARLRMSDRQLRGHARAGNIAYTNVGLKQRPAYRFRAADIAAFELSRTNLWQKSEGSTAARATRDGPTTLSSQVIDFAARQAARTAARPKNGSSRSGRKNGRK